MHQKHPSNNSKHTGSGSHSFLTVLKTLAPFLLEACGIGYDSTCQMNQKFLYISSGHATEPFKLPLWPAGRSPEKRPKSVPGNLTPSSTTICLLKSIPWVRWSLTLVQQNSVILTVQPISIWIRRSSSSHSCR